MATKAFDGHICCETMGLIVKRQIVITHESGKPVRYHPLHQLFLIPIKSKRVHAIILTWIVERGFAWLGHNRRLSKDYEYSVKTSETLIGIAATRLILNRLASA